jgi:outer membrane immunogenic protein
MKKIIFGTLFALISGFASSQGTVPVGKSQFNIGVGFSDVGTPIYFGIDYGALQNVTVGGEFSYRSYRESWESDYYNHNIMGFSGNGNYHFNQILRIPQRFDFYAGINLGFYVWTSPDAYGGSNSSELGFGGQIGGRYFLSQRVGLNLEFGGGNAFSGGKLGLTVKL